MIEILLDQLSDYQAQRSLIEIKKQELIDGIYTQEIKVKLQEIDAEFTTQYEGVDANITAITEQIKQAVIDNGASVKGSFLHAVYAKGRVSWDSKTLDGLALVIPEVLKARKEGEPSISIRKI